MLLSPFNIILMRTFFKRTIPEAILESARIDGASKTRIFFQIVAIVSSRDCDHQFVHRFGFWNDWFNALLYIKSDNLYPFALPLDANQNNMDYIAKNVGYPANWQELYNPSHGKQDVWPWWLWQQCQSPFSSILPTLLCKRLDHRWCERITSFIENQQDFQLIT